MLDQHTSIIVISVLTGMVGSACMQIARYFWMRRKMPARLSSVREAGAAANAAVTMLACGICSAPITVGIVAWLNHLYPR